MSFTTDQDPPIQVTVTGSPAATVTVAHDDQATTMVVAEPAITLIVDEGLPGPPGPVGPAGPPGASSTACPYEWKTNTLATNPAHGFIKANTTPSTAYTEFYVSVYDKNGAGLLALNSLTAGDAIFLYEAGQITTWDRFTLTAPPVMQGTPVDWAILAVVFAESGGLPFTPGGNTQVLLVTPVKGEPGLVKVTHGADPNLPRPDVPLVYWVGSVTPVNADPDDLLMLKG